MTEAETLNPSTVTTKCVLCILAMRGVVSSRWWEALMKQLSVLLSLTLPHIAENRNGACMGPGGGSRSCPCMALSSQKVYVPIWTCPEDTHKGASVS